MQRISNTERAAFGHLFGNVPALHTTVASVLEGRCGELYAGPDGTAWIVAAPFWFPAGPTAGANADLFVKTIREFGGVLVTSEDWMERVERELPGRSSRTDRTPYSADSLSAERLETLLTTAQEGVEIRRMDAALVAAAASEISDSLLFASSFDGPQSFVRDGIGFCVLEGGKPVAGASSAVVSSTAIEVQINTHPDCRGRGLATLASASLLGWCLENGLTPNWDTGNSVSERLAERLGYRRLPGYQMLEVAPPGMTYSSSNVGNSVVGSASSGHAGRAW